MAALEQWEELRNKIIGLGEQSSRKSYYPEFQHNIGELERFKSLIDKTVDAIFQADAVTGIINEVNDAAAKMLRINKEEFFNRSVYQFFPDAVSLKIQSLCKTYAESPNSALTLQSTIGAVVGSKSLVELIVQVVEFDHKPYLVIIARDVSERVESEKQLKYSENKLRTIFDSTSDAIFIYDVGGRIFDVNNSMLKMFHVSRKEALRFSIMEYSAFSNSISDFRNLYRRIFNGETAIVEWKARRPLTNTFFDVEVALNRMEWKEKMLIVAAVRDITSRKASEKELADSYLKIKRINDELTQAKEKAEESDQLKTAFLQNISHEIRTPMNAIVGFANLLNEPDLTPDRQQEFTQIILQSSKQLLSIITDIVNIASIETGQEKVNDSEVNISLMLSQLYEQFVLKAQIQKLGFRYKLDIPDKETYVITDETKLTQILSNLLGNAIKFTPKGEIVFGCTINGDELQFYVKDTGIGIPVNMHKEIFKRFRQVSNSVEQIYGGSGLGLSISKAYSELLGGRIWVSSQPGLGSTFYFTIPYRRTRGVSSEEEAIGFIADKDLIVLIAEDEEFNFRYLSEILSMAKFTIIRAANGAEAVEKCKVYPHIDLILMDIKMPIMDGYEATRQIRKLFPDLPVIAQTAYAHDISKTKALQSGFSDYICKPISKSDLFKKIKEQLDV